ncbi:MAG TPA: hypothetical protein VMD09_05070 [Solirubrobacteraceae bacterium]|nr:hypothetical protein [Solirubrobacteraceae bacterium]
MVSEPRIAPRAGVLDHLSARLYSHHLDQALARGIPPESAAPLALRARRLTALPRRRVIAAGLRRAIRETCLRVPSSRSRISPRRAEVAAASDELTRLADGLADVGPVAARGAAEAWILLTDGTGPLYNPDSPASLRARALSAANDLRLAN